MTETWIQEQQQLKNDFDTLHQQLVYWGDEFKRLSHSLEPFVAELDNLYQQSEIPTQLPEELVEKLSNRRDGLRLTMKGASRFTQKLNLDQVSLDEHYAFEEYDFSSESETSEEELVEVEQHQVTDEVQGDTSEANVEIEENQEQDDVSEADVEVQESSSPEPPESYVLLMEKNKELLQSLREQLEHLERHYTKFFEKTYAPVMDGVYSGLKHGETLKSDIHQMEIGEADKEAAIEWLTIYSTMLAKFENFLKDFAVEPVDAEQGQPFDEKYHEPIAVVEDQAYQTEDISEVVRYGLHFSHPLDEDASYLLRPVQVIVVKNPAQPTPSEDEREEVDYEI